MNEKKRLRRQSQVELIQEPPNGGWGWMVILGGIISLMNWSGIQRCYSVFYLPLIDEFEVDFYEVAWLNGLFGIGYGISCLLAPALTNRFGFRPVVMTCGVCLSLLTVFASYSFNLWQIQLFAGLLQGAFMGPVAVSIFTVTNRYFTSRRNLATQILCMGLALGGFAFCPAYQSLIQQFGWRGAFQVIAGFVLHISVTGALLRPIVLESDFTKHVTLDEYKESIYVNADLNNNVEDEKAKKHSLSSASRSISPDSGFQDNEAEFTELKSNQKTKTTFTDDLKKFSRKINLHVLTKSYFYFYIFSWLALMMAYFSSLTYLVPYGKEVLGLTEMQASTLMSAVMAGEIFSRVIYGVSFDKLPKHRRMPFAAFILLMMAVAFLSLPFLRGYTSILIGCVFVGMTGGGMDGVYSVFMVDLFGLNLYASVFGYGNIIIYSLQMAGTVLIGKIIDYTKSYMLIFFMGAGFAVVASMFTMLMHRSLTRKQKKEDFVTSNND